MPPLQLLFQCPQYGHPPFKVLSPYARSCSSVSLWLWASQLVIRLIVREMPNHRSVSTPPNTTS